VVDLVLYLLRFWRDGLLRIPASSCLVCPHVVVVAVSLLFCKLLEGVVNAPSLLMLHLLFFSSFTLNAVELVFITGRMGYRGEGRSWTSLLLGPALLPAAVLVLHLHELIYLFLVEILTQRSLSICDFYLQTLGPLGVLVVQPIHPLLALTFLHLSLCQFLPPAVPTSPIRYLLLSSMATLSIKYFLSVSMVLESSSVCSRHFSQ
jgi:hypothetical protein